jgi:hypothetical protein
VAEATGQATLAGKLRGGFGDLLKPAAFTGDLCFAPSDGQRVRFTRPDRWLGAWEPADPEAATAQLVQRYLAAYGPAPREQFQRWFGMSSPAEAGRWLRGLGDEVTEVDVEKSRGWMLAADAAAAAGAEPSGIVRLLPAFDHYLVAAPRDAEAILPAGVRARVYRPQGWISPALLVDGRVAGVWSHEVGRGRVAVAIEPFARVPAAVRRAAEAEAARLAAFLGGDPEVTWA